MASPGAHRSVSAIAEDCIARFESLTASANPARREGLENRGSDFRLWCDGVGARVQGLASLDSRLQGRQEDLDFVKSIMRLLADFLAEYDACQSQAQVETATQNIDSALGSLSRLGLSIRQLGKASRTRRADRRFDPDEHEEFRTHLRCILLLRPTADRHSMKDIEESRLSQLQKRLIDCNLRRRNRFLLAQKHSEKLKASQRTPQSSRPAERPSAPLPLPSSSGHDKDETKATELKATTESGPRPLREAERAGANLPSAASTTEGTPLALCDDTAAKTTITSLARTKEFPRPPKPLIGRRIYRCPCCFQSLPDSILLSPIKWAKHLVEDLCPYTCIAEDCPDPQRMFTSRQQWEHHFQDQHPPRWHCPLCDKQDLVLRSIDATKDHIRADHQNEMDDYSLDTVVSWCRVKRVGITTCPLCASNGPLDSPELVDHVLSHTYDFALRALPWPLAARNKASTTIGTYCSLVSQDVTEEWEESISYQETRRLSWVKNLKLEEGTPDWRTDNDDIYPFATPQVWDNPGIQLSSLEKKMESAAKSDEFEDGVDYFADGGYFEDESADGSSEPQIDGNSRHSRQKEDQYSRPSCREDFEIAIICALILEYDAVALLFDEFWDEDGDEFGRAAGDDNTYTTGRIGNHNVVLALLPGMGKVSEAAAAANMRSTYVALRLVLLAGICGGAPHYNQYEILLGDVIISNTVIQYNFGRRYPDAFASKRDENIRTLLATFETDLGRDELRKTTAYFLRQLQKNAGNRQNKYKYPGTAEDKLFESGHRHKHRISPACICSHCHGRMDPVCAGALASSCNDLGCDERYLVKRNRLEARRQLEQGGKNEVQDPAIYAGTIASSDTIIKSGEDRDRIIQEEGIIAFQMEGAGVWEEVPHIMVKGVCDYADCHKNKKWQDFAAATAASALKAILERYNQTDKRQGPVVEELPCHFLVPFKRNRGFVGREAILSELLGRILPGTNKEDCQRTIIQGLGGVGKTQIALEAIYRLRNKRLDCSIFWVSAADVNTFENSYREIGRHIKIKGIDEEKADVKRLVKTALSDESIGSWLLVVDNADDTGLLFEPICLSDYLPFSRKGSILLTTRNQTVASRLGIQGASIITTAEMYDVEARFMLYQGLNPSQISNANSTERLLHILANLPLAIRQACAYMAENQISTSEYLNLCESKRDMIRLLGRDFDDPHQYKSIPNAVTTTWLTSFNHISKHDPPAAEYLKFMSLLAEKDIPKSLLPMEAIGTLEAYAFIAQREGQDSIDMHRLVRIAVQNWLEGKGELNVYVTSAIQRLNHAFPFPKHENKDIWIRYLPHAETALKFQVQHKGGKVEASLLNKVAHSYYLLGQYQKAEQVYWQALQLCREVLGKEHPDTLISMNNLASVLSDLGKDEEAEKMHRQTLQLKEKVLGKEHPSTLKSLDNLGEVLLKLEKWNELEQLNRQILLMHRRRADELADTTAKGESARQGAPVYAKKSE